MIFLEYIYEFHVIFNLVYIRDLIVLAVVSYYGQIFLNTALKYENASKITPILYIQIVFVFLYDQIVFNSTLQYVGILGCVIVIFSCFHITQ